MTSNQSNQLFDPLRQTCSPLRTVEDRPLNCVKLRESPTALFSKGHRSVLFCQSWLHRCTQCTAGGFILHTNNTAEQRKSISCYCKSSQRSWRHFTFGTWHSITHGYRGGGAERAEGTGGRQRTNSGDGWSSTFQYSAEALNQKSNKCKKNSTICPTCPVYLSSFIILIIFSVCALNLFCGKYGQ